MATILAIHATYTIAARIATFAVDASIAFATFAAFRAIFRKITVETKFAVFTSVNVTAGRAILGLFRMPAVFAFCTPMTSIALFRFNALFTVSVRICIFCLVIHWMILLSPFRQTICRFYAKVERKNRTFLLAC